MIYILTKNHRELAAPIVSGNKLIHFLNGIREVGLDIETTGLIPLEDEIMTIQFGNEIDQYIIEYSEEYIPLLVNILSMSHLTFILQNAKFDLQFLYLATNTVPDKVYDTFLAERVLHMGRIGVRAGLGILAKRYLKREMSKQDVHILHRGLNHIKVVKYSAEDVEVLPLIKKEQQLLIDRFRIGKAVSLENLFVKALAYLELSGIYLDKEAWEKKCLKDDEALKTQETLLNRWVIDHTEKLGLNQFAVGQADLFNPEPKCNVLWTSPDQVVALFKKIGINTLTVDKKTGELKDSVESSVLAYQAEKFPIIPIYIKYRKCTKNVSTYGRNFYDHISNKTGRIHSKFNQLVDTGRLSSGGKDKIAKVEYINLQNIPSDNASRGCFVPNLGNDLICADYDQQEQVIFANRSLDSKLLEFYDNKLGDMHKQQLCIQNWVNSGKLLMDNPEPSYVGIHRRCND